MRFDPEKIKKDAKENFDLTWNEGKKLVKTPSLNERYPRTTLKGTQREKQNTKSSSARRRLHDAVYGRTRPRRNRHDENSDAASAAAEWRKDDQSRCL